jgi:C4-dicarboxylate-specific signal transduction histidine kinase
MNTNPPDADHPLRLPRQVYRLRILGLGLGFCSVASVFHDHGASALAWAALSVHGFLWPHVAWWRVRRARDPHAAERTHLLTDATTCGAWIALMGFCVLPSVLVAAMQSMDKIGWGRRFLFRAISQMALACVATTLLVRASFRPEASMLVVVASLPLMVAYPIAVASAMDRSGRLARERRKAVEQASALREQLAHVSRVGTLGEMAAGLAHELNQPLTAIHLEASAALELGGEGELREALASIGEQSLRAGEIVRRMRSFARRSASQREVVDLDGIVTGVVRLLEHELRLAGVTTDVLVDDGVLVRADRIEIEQVLVNLIRNGIDAMRGATSGVRRLTLRTAVADGCVRVSVADTGGGIAPAIELELFHPFKSTKPAGLGLGLSICQTLIEAHGGKIGAGPHPAGGALFFFELPISEPQAQVAS